MWKSVTVWNNMNIHNKHEGICRSDYRNPWNSVLTCFQDRMRFFTINECFKSWFEKLITATHQAIILTSDKMSSNLSLGILMTTSLVLLPHWLDRLLFLMRNHCLMSWCQAIQSALCGGDPRSAPGNNHLFNDLKKKVRSALIFNLNWQYHSLNV